MAQGRLHLGNRPAPVHPGFYFFTISVLYYSIMYYSTGNYSTIYYSTTTPSVCISETDLRRFTQDFTILLFYYSSTTTPAVCISETDAAPVHPGFYYFVILLFCDFSTVLFYYVLFCC